VQKSEVRESFTASCCGTVMANVTVVPSFQIKTVTCETYSRLTLHFETTVGPCSVGLKQCFSTRVREIKWVRRRLWMSPQALAANKFAVMPSHHSSCTNLYNQPFRSYSHSNAPHQRENVKYFCSTWYLYFWGNVVSSLSVKLLSKLQFALSVSVYNC